MSEQLPIKLANPRGFCAGVDRAIEIVNRALDVFGAPIYVRHEVVHNKFVVDNLRVAQYLSTSSMKYRTVVLLFSARTAYRRRCESKPIVAA